MPLGSSSSYMVLYEGLNGVVAFTGNGSYFGFFTAIGYFFSITVNRSYKN